MKDHEGIKTRIRMAFGHEKYPGDDNLRRGDLGFEPYLVEDEFRGKSDWAVLDADFLDQSPEGLSSALSFLSDDAFRFYIPAYMIADLDRKLKRVDPVFHLVYNLDDPSGPRSDLQDRHNENTPFESAANRFRAFTPEEASAVEAYLTYQKSYTTEEGRHEIEMALANYWRHHVE
jgi:hypothetical protein